MERLILLGLIATLFFAGAFTFYYYNSEVLLQPTSSFDFNESLAPIGASLPGEMGAIFDGTNYIFYYSSDGVSAETLYSIDTSSPSVQKGLITIHEVLSGISPVIEGGTYWRDQNGVILTPLQFSQQASVSFSHEINGNVVSLNYIETLNGFTREKRFDFEISGKTLIVKANAINPSTDYLNNYAGFGFGKINGSNNALAVQVPYMKTATVSSINNNFFVSTYIDWTKSSSNAAPLQSFPQQIANSYRNSFYSQYIPGQNNIYPALSETAYITLSNNIHETFMKIHREKSQYRDDLSHRLALNLARINEPSVYFGNQGQSGRFVVNSKTIINQLDEYGVKDLFFILKSSLALRSNSVTYPEICPPSPWYGSQEGYNQLKETALDKNYLFAPFHDDKIDMFQQSIYWNNYCDSNRNPLNQESAEFPIAIDPEGKCKLSGWYTPSQGQGLYYYYIAQDKLMNFAQQEAICTQNWVDGSAYYLDVLAKVDLRELVDYSSFNSNSRTISQGFVHNKEIHDFVHQTADGPIVAEGGEHNLVGIDTYLAGKIDAHNREIFGREDAPVIPDFELMVYNKLSVGHGMGSFERWVRQAPGSFSWAQPINLGQFAIDKGDKYRATTIAFGHAGFFDDVFLWETGSSASVPEFYNYYVKEYYIFSELQKLYLESPVQNILYNRNGQMRNLGDTIRSFSSQAEYNNYFQNETQLKTIYENGLEVYVNRHIANIWSINVNSQDYYLPANGWLAFHPESNLLVYSALVDDSGNPAPSGHRVDYARTPNYIMLNGRGIQTIIGEDYSGNPLASTYLTVIRPNGWKLLENSTGGLSVTINPPYINQLNPNSFQSSPNPPWVYVTRDSSQSRLFSYNFGIQIKESSNPQWPQTPPFYCFYSSSSGSSGLGTCEYIDSDSVRFKTQNNPLIGSYDVRYVDLTDITDPSISNVVSLTVTAPPICGDNICNGLESCSTCVGDCGVCPGTIPNAPSGLTIGSPTTSSLTLTWIDNSNDEDGFIINYKAHSSSAWSIIDIPTPNTLTYTHTGLNPNTEYDYQILAYNSIGQSGVYPSSTTYISGMTTSPPNPSSSSGGGGGGGGGGSSAPRTPVTPSQGSTNVPENEIPQTVGIEKEEKDELVAEEKNIEIRAIFWMVSLLLLSAIVFVTILIIRRVRFENRFKKITSVVQNRFSN